MARGNGTPPACSAAVTMSLHRKWLLPFRT